MNKFKWSSVGLSVVLIVALLVWMASGEIKQTETKAPERSAQQNTELSRVEVTTLNARNYQPELLVQGQVLPWRSVMVSARVSATVKSLVVELGDTVSQGQTLLTLTLTLTDDRSLDGIEWRLKVNREAAARFGTDVASIGNAVRLVAIGLMLLILVTQFNSLYQSFLILSAIVLGINVDLITPSLGLNAPSTQWWTQMSSAIAGGLTFATLLTLLLTPALLVLGEQSGQKVKQLLGARGRVSNPSPRACPRESHYPFALRASLITS